MNYIEVTMYKKTKKINKEHPDKEHPYGEHHGEHRGQHMLAVQSALASRINHSQCEKVSKWTS